MRREAKVAASGPRAGFVGASAPLAVTPAEQLVAPARGAAAAAQPRAPGAYARFGKRALDLTLGSLLLLLALPLMLAVALAVLVTSGWPVLYRSERLGAGGTTFRMWKFRTMVRDADHLAERWKETHPERASELLTRWQIEADPRVTALGRFLRASSLDELPQLWHVVRGDMSLVGPRPYLPREAIAPAARAAILAVKPGLTGPFQVCGRKSLTPTSRIEMEVAYGEAVSLRRDLALLLRTAKPLLTLDGR